MQRFSKVIVMSFKQFVRNSASMEGVALDQTSAHARTDSLETAVNKVSTQQTCVLLRPENFLGRMCEC